MRIFTHWMNQTEYPVHIHTHGMKIHRLFLMKMETQLWFHLHVMAVLWLETIVDNYGD